MLPLLMMLPEPCFRIWGAACFMPSITLRTSVAIAASKRSTSRPSMPPVCAGPPALLNRQSMRPNFSTESPISAFICSSTVTSVWRKTQVAPSFLASASPSGARRPAITIFAPSATNSSAVCSPMPLVAPVITATFPSSRPTSSSPCRNRFHQYSRPLPTRQASLFHRGRPCPAAFLAPGIGGARIGIATAIAGGALGATINFSNAVADSARLALLLMFWAVCGFAIWGVEHYRTIVAQQREDSKRLIREEEYRKLLVEELQHRLKNKTSTIHAVLHQVLQDQPHIWGSIDRRLRALSATDDMIARLDGT